jgi:predicted secreted hydrolase
MGGTHYATGRWLALALSLALLLALAGAAYSLSQPPTVDQLRAEVQVGEALGGSAEGFARATEPRPFVFPADHGPHPEYRTEWWYYTGNLAAADGRHFGFQLTFFRNALTSEPAERTSKWATNHVYMAHFALTDVDGGGFHAFERFGRAALGLAGAEATPFRVWLEDWSASEIPGPPTAAGQLPRTRLVAAQDGIAIDLVLGADEAAPGKPLVLQGDRGLSQKGPEPGNASYYYSATRLATTGTVSVNGQAFEVDGLSWLDREWSTSALSEGQAGWDWFALQLDDGREVMYYRLRLDDGGTDPFSAGVLVEADGTSARLSGADVVLEETGTWRSPRSGASYPSGWRLSIPGAGLALEIAPHLADQELNVTVRYWEGAVRVAGNAAGRPLTGNGYVELTGYGDTLQPLR